MSMENCANTKPKITIIPAKTRVERLDPMSVAMGQKPKIRVAAYARVSTDHEEQDLASEKPTSFAIAAIDKSVFLSKLNASFKRSSF